MKILRMTASFGTLQKEELVLSDGLNVITRPNESGKSTWSAFLLAMLYGIDTSQRAKTGVLPDKTRYRPWSGSSMEGRMEVLWNGRHIVLERTGTAKAPMSVFRAYDAESGQAIEELTGETCGEMLTGAERSVFERSAFMRQAGLSVSADTALDRRLSALVTTGEESVSAPDTLKRLREMKNHIQHNRTGRIPALTQELDEVNGALEKIRVAHRNDLSLHEREQTLSARRQELETVDAALEAVEQERKLRQKKLAEQALAEAIRAEQAQKETVKALPAQEVLQELGRQLASAENTVLPPVPMQSSEKPDCPAVFSGVPEDDILPKAQADVREFDRLTAGKKAFWQLWLAVLLLAGAGMAAVLLLKKSVWLAVLCGIAALFGAAMLLRSLIRNAQIRKDRAQADALRQAYCAEGRDEFVPFAAQYHTALLVWKQQAAQAQREREQYARSKSDYEKRVARLIGSVSMFCPQAEDLPGVRLALSQAQAQYDACRQAAMQTENARARLEMLAQAVGDVTNLQLPEGDWSAYDRAQVRRELEDVRTEQAQIRSRLDLSRGRVEGFGDPAQLYARKEALEKELAELRERYAALELAESAMQQAGSELETRFAPQLAKETGAIFAELTGRRYDRVLLGRDFRLEAGQTGEPAMRQLLALSGGTADQLYLAVRLAICRLVLGKEAPLVLDDALVMFDDARMEKALQVLKEEAKTRQILLFSCQKREKAALENLK